MTRKINLDYWFAVKSAFVRAYFYWFFHKGWSVYCEYRHVEVRGQRDAFGYTLFREEYTYIALVKGTHCSSTLQVRDYFGERQGPETRERMLKGT